LIRNRLGSLGEDPYGGEYGDTSGVGSSSSGWGTPPFVEPSKSGGTDWAQFGAVLATDATKLAQPFIQSSLPPPQYVQGAYGAQVLYNPQTGQVTQAKQTLPSGLDAPVGSRGVFGSGSTLPLLVIAGLAVLLVMGEAKK
jgi:hypothetical protein